MRHHERPIALDYKLRVFKTGQADDSYVFLGGYQMNINVGQSFSVGRSDSYSVGWGVEATDLVGAAGGFTGALGRLGVTGSGRLSDSIAPLSSAIKPLSLKLSGGTSVSSSDGTSISESTYLVAQIAKFRVRLDEYERCVGLEFSAGFTKSLEIMDVMSYVPERDGAVPRLFVCEGERMTDPRFVDEHYFYFTQHFTEGDMLDQADLYNHPWLLALRGTRDFGSFVGLVRKQESISAVSAVRNWFTKKDRSIDWPLAHMRESYRRITPSFPGFYTVLDADEGLTEFPLELAKRDRDKFFEMRSRERRYDQQRNLQR